MEARTLLQKIRQRGYTIKAAGNDISLAPKKLLNDKMVSFIKKHKNELLTALYKEHDEQKARHLNHKRTLRQGRLEILGLIIQRYCNFKSPNNDIKIEDFIDEALIYFNYDLEKVIDYYRSISPEPKIIDGRCRCNYMPPFCSCKNICSNDFNNL